MATGTWTSFAAMVRSTRRRSTGTAAVTWTRHRRGAARPRTPEVSRWQTWTATEGWTSCAATSPAARPCTDLNSSGHLDASPSWSGPPEDTRSVALADVDGDGRLDLVRGNFAGGTTLYMNIGSAFALAPAWTGEGGTKSVALGDVNEDGFPDVVCGNDAQASALYLHRSPWAIDATGHAPRNQLPNNPAYLRSVHVVASGSNTYHVSFQAFDLESDALTLVGEY